MTNQSGIFSHPYRLLTIGIILAVTVVAFEGLAVTTVAPTLAKDLNGIGLFGWVFSAYLLAQLTATVLTGQQIDRRGPALPFVVALVLFGLGLVVAAIASSMPLLIVGRTLQGFGAGGLVTSIYSSIFLRYEDSLRTQILAVFSAAYVIPALVGPYVAGVIAERLSWRFVFWGLLPFLLLAAILTLPTFLRIKTDSKPAQHIQIWLAFQLAVGAGLVLTGLGQLPQMIGIWLALGGLILVILPLRRLLPAGTLVARPGLSALIAARGLFVASYFGIQTFLVLALTVLKGYAADTAGLIVASGALSWSIAAWLQARLDRRDDGQGRQGRVLKGVVLMLIGAGVTMLVIWMPVGELLVAIGGCILIGFRIGLAHPTSGAIAFTYATDRTEGAISADLQVADTFTPAVSIGIGGALVAISHTLGWKTSIGIAAALEVQLLLIMVSLIAATRLTSNQKVRST